MSNKRRRIDFGDGEEPEIDLSVPASTATVMLDSAQEGRFPEGVNSTYMEGIGGLLAKGDPLPFAAGPISVFDNIGEAISTQAKSLFQSGNNQGFMESRGIQDVGDFDANVNAMSGCSRTKYFGSFTDDTFFDTHRGNGVLSIRAFIEPTDLTDAHPYFIKDFFIRLPDGLVFQGDKKKDVRRLAALINYQLRYQAFPSGHPPFDSGWHNPATTTFLPNSLAFGSVLTTNAQPGEYSPQSSPYDFGPLITCYANSDDRLVFSMDTGALDNINLPIWKGPYKDSNSTFFLFDHPQGLANRGGFFSGMGYLNPMYGKESHLAGPTDNLDFVHGDKKVRRPLHTTYNLGGNLVLREKLPFSVFEYPVGTISATTIRAGTTNKVKYFEVKELMINKYFKTASGSPWASFRPNITIDVSQLVLIKPSFFGGGPNQYVSPRSPSLKDVRYYSHVSDEICFDRKFSSFFQDSLPIANTDGAVIFGIDFKEYDDSEVAKKSSVGRWRENLYQGTEYNPAINLAPGVSLMRLEVRSYNNYGERLISEPKGMNQEGQGRNLVSGEKFIPVAFTGDKDLIQYAQFIKPPIANANIGYANPLPFSTKNLYTVNFPPFANYGPAIGFPLPTTINKIDDANQKIPPIPAFEQDLDKNYFDNGVRVGANSSIVHFFMNYLY